MPGPPAQDWSDDAARVMPVTGLTATLLEPQGADEPLHLTENVAVAENEDFEIEIMNIIPAGLICRIYDKKTRKTESYRIMHAQVAAQILESRTQFYAENHAYRHVE